MSRDPYRSSAGDLGFGGRGGGTRWDQERFAMERDRARFEERDRYEERDTRISRGGFAGRVRERSVDEIYERRGPHPEDDRYERRHYHDDEPRLERERPFGRDRGHSVTIEKEREREYYHSPSPPPRRGPPARPGFLRRQSSLDTYDRKPLVRYEREEYGPPARYREPIQPPVLTPIPLPTRRALGPPPARRYEREYYDEIEVAEPDYYGDEVYRGYPERVREREVIRKRRSRSKDSRRSHSVRGSVRSSSVSSSSSDETVITVKSEFPKKGKTRMPGRLVNKKAISDLGYPYEEEGDTVILLKALGRENIDEVIKLSEDYNKSAETTKETTVIEERKEVVFVDPPAPPPPAPAPVEIVQETKIVEHVHPPDHHHHHGSGPIILDAGPREESTFIRKEREVIERSDPMPVGPLALALPHERHRSKDERAIRAEIRALEAEKEALRAEKRAEREMRKADRIRHGAHGGRSSDSELVLYDQETYRHGHEEVTLVRRERVEEPEGGVRIEKDRKAPPPRVIRAMLKTLT